MFSYISLEERLPQDHHLRLIKKIVGVILKDMWQYFSRMYSKFGRRSIPPEQLLRALLLQAFYTIRSERMLVEHINYNLIVRRFVGLGMDEKYGIFSPLPRTGIVFFGLIQRGLSLAG